VELQVNTNENPDKFAVIDPHDSTRDIASGTHRANEVVHAFQDAYRKLKHTMLHSELRRSILGCIIGGDYRPYINQRQKLRQVSEDVAAGRLKAPSTAVSNQQYRNPTQKVSSSRWKKRKS
jgi:hypothetical protein